MSKSIIGFLRRSYLMVGLFGWPEEKNALIDNPLAKATTPDGIIEAACINSIARDFDAWTRTCVRDGYKEHSKMLTKTGREMMHHMDSRYIYSTYMLKNEEKNIVITWEGNSYSDKYKDYKVNGVQFPDKNGYAIVSAYENLRMERVRAKAKADAALAEMKRLEGAWDLAENLLGLKRNEFGALVPKEEITDCVGKRKDKMCYCSACKGMKHAR